jgi:hypothetical protein
MREIEDHPVVSSLCFIRAIGRDKAGYRANLRCGCKQVGPVRMSSTRTTLQDCLRELGRLIQQDHGLTWVEFGFPGHGKGPWDGLGAMVKTKVTLDITHGKERTMTDKITSPILVAQHLRATFCTNEWLMEHVDSRINEMVVMYQSADEALCQKTIQLLVSRMLACARARTWIPVKWSRSLGVRLYAF